LSVTVSIVTFDSERHIAACLDAVRAQGDIVGEVLVADNGSRDGTLQRIRDAYPEVRVDALGHNTGFAAAHNRNYARSEGRYFLALNPDVTLDSGHLDTLVDRLERAPHLGAAGGRLLAAERPGRLDSAGIRYDALRTRFIDRGRGLPAGAFARDEDVFGTCGAATLYRRSALECVSREGERPFAERLFMYYEDVDLAWRLGRAGWRIRYCPDASATHARGGSGANAAFVEYHLVRNRLWVSLRNAAPREFLGELPGLALFGLVKSFQALHRPHVRAALRDQWLGVPATLRARRRGLRGA
jgi:GT2 family glycosyltransferase